MKTRPHFLGTTVNQMHSNPQQHVVQICYQMRTNLTNLSDPLFVYDFVHYAMDAYASQ